MKVEEEPTIMSNEAEVLIADVAGEQAGEGEGGTFS